jgi:hypothetical protein
MTYSQAMNIPEAASTLSTPRSIMPTITTKASPAVTTTRKLVLVSSASIFDRLRNELELIVAARPISTKNPNGRRIAPGRPNRPRPMRRQASRDVTADALAAFWSILRVPVRPGHGRQNRFCRTGWSRPRGGVRTIR